MSSNGAFSNPARRFFNEVKQYVQEKGRTHMGISFRDTTTSFTSRFWGTYWQQRLSCALTGTSAARLLRMLASDRLRADRILRGAKNVHTAAREYGRDGHDVPVAQSTDFSLASHSSDDDSAPNLAHISLNDSSQAAIWQDAQLDNPDILAAYNPTHPQAGVHNAVDTNNNTDDTGSVCDPSTSTTTSPKTSASFVTTSSLTNRASISDKSTVDLVGTTDYNLETHSPNADLVPTLAHLSSGNGSPAVNLNLPPSQAGVQYDVNINNNTDDDNSFCDPSTSTTTSPKTSASFVTSSLTNRASLSDKSTVDLVGTTDYNLETHSPDADLVTTLAHLSSGNGSPAVNLNLPPSQTGAQYGVNINNNTDNEDSLCDPSMSTTTSPKTSASFVTSSLTNRVSLLSLSDKSTVGMAGNTDYATGSFCSSCSIKPTLLRRFWLDGTGCAMCSYDNGG